MGIDWEFSRMATVTEEQILSCLANIQDPEAQNDIVTLGMVKGLVVKNGNVGFSIARNMGPRKRKLSLIHIRRCRR